MAARPVNPVSKGAMTALVAAAGLLGAGLCWPGPAGASPVFCGAHAAPANCLPTAGQTAFLDDIRGRAPGDDAQLLATGIAACNMLKGGDNVNDVIAHVAAQMGVVKEVAGQVVDSATAYVCPGAPLNEYD